MAEDGAKYMPYCNGEQLYSDNKIYNGKWPKFFVIPNKTQIIF